MSHKTRITIDIYHSDANVVAAARELVLEGLDRITSRVVKKFAKQNVMVCTAHMAVIKSRVRFPELLTTGNTGNTEDTKP